MFFVAITREGAEFLYNRDTAHSVPAASAERIAAMLNNAGYMLNGPEQTWHVYEGGSYERNWTAAGYQKFYINRGRLMRGRC